ncbi:precorrin-6y C5,15-methyltransferase (decarboxylating) subunit CbiE [Coleofasciculus sp. FACHB-64]|uniref:precorrin-6y C5,15-methyltransferase (decarboxylating) subunit CbiE n=1 Tax=Cyanophyceae TaxID=3028117 RepID=UPI001684A9C5|nr:MULTISPECIES: precorrin-6y C5,15-methyltransferase (decarboxylating) subunit CbiE [unclassified Coleofasciculus]MBD1837112.1 precorrin-6y C5,15-methyltransferase (decarboxylating) subunit CbiE [Coleofasciculus sp. FACHB-501]MBD2048679.1 precorrin-6y C5,15-methyltransferase (decarboxylating) subunit CbiE [Coleofasciculus sp. FACHB-64]
MTLVHVVGIGLDGADGLSHSVREIVEQAMLLIGSDRHLSYFPNSSAQRLILGDLTKVVEEIRDRLSAGSGGIVVLVSGDPLFFGLGRLLVAQLPSAELTFHPHLSSVQLAFNRIKVPWQDARVISAHGRSLDELTQALQQGIEKIAVLTDTQNTPEAIARLLLALDLPSTYQFWVCENLGGADERVRSFPCVGRQLMASLQEQDFASLNVVVLLRPSDSASKSGDAFLPNLDALPMLGVPDGSFLSFSDRPGLMTKREVRVLVLGELALQPGQIIWDIGAGTGSVSIEIARLFPTSRVYAIEKTAAGTMLIQQNCDRFQVENVISIHGSAPEALYSLPAPNRIFIGGSGGNLTEILDTCNSHLTASGRLVLALATLEHLNEALSWLSRQQWDYHLLQVQLSRSVPVGSLTRFSPLNPVTILAANRSF